MTILVKPNQIVTNHGIYMNMHPSLRKRFSELEIAPRIWKYTDEQIQPGVLKIFRRDLKRYKDNCVFNIVDNCFKL